MASSSPRAVHKLNYIGAKARLADWICDLCIAGLPSEISSSVTDDSRPLFVADLFCGSGDITRALRERGIATVSVDAEQYAKILTHAWARGTYNDRVRAVIEQINNLPPAPLSEKGIIEREYSSDPLADDVPLILSPTRTRSFFTTDNARRIDNARHYLDQIHGDLREDDWMFILASIIVSADKVANIAAVFGAYLKKFKQSACVPFRVEPIHTISSPSNIHNRVCKRILPFAMCGNADPALEMMRDVRVVYLDPPYNARQYSKNYFVLNIIAQDMADDASRTFAGVTGIPNACYISPFCQKRRVADAFAQLFAQLARCMTIQLILMSYNDEGLMTMEQLKNIAMMQFAHRTPVCAQLSRTFRRFKSTRARASATTTEFILRIELTT